jgi:hypothetical protein
MNRITMLALTIALFVVAAVGGANQIIQNIK